MPNWCENVILLDGSKKEINIFNKEIERLQKFSDETNVFVGLFSSFASIEDEKGD